MEYLKYQTLERHKLLSYTFTWLTEVMIGLLLNGLGVVKRSQDGEVNDRPRKTAMTSRRE